MRSVADDIEDMSDEIDKLKAKVKKLKKENTVLKSQLKLATNVCLSLENLGPDVAMGCAYCLDYRAFEAWRKR